MLKEDTGSHLGSGSTESTMQDWGLWETQASWEWDTEMLCREGAGEPFSLPQLHL